jgi:hypothetical protein
MTEQLGRRAAMVLLGSMLLGVSVGLVAWGPIVRPNGAHVYADSRTLMGLPNALNALSSGVMLLVAVWGLRVTWLMDGSVPVRRVWLCFQACAAVGGVMSTMYHLRPSTGLLLLASVMLSAGFVLLFLSILAERIHPQFGSPAGVASALALVACMALMVSLSSDSVDQVDIRPLLLLQIPPLLLIPAGALSLRGHGTRTTDWVAVLMLYSLAKLFEFGDAAVFAWTGWVSGHTLMHLALAAVVGWVGYCARRDPSWSAFPSSATDRKTSRYTSS